eukprot:TRINITY_DN1924_c0_g1_i1.p1 TRINITY_DN1924_c0_g1~~TRINITY_DN1924_c0_g1_i1.p1  ORF type:complete len:149 (+),score=21.77 TRINITY_DN1924_c0_g1_i1:752-1198(+)
MMNEKKLVPAINQENRYSYNKETKEGKHKGWYRCTLDHILIQERNLPRIVKTKIKKNTYIKSDHLSHIVGVLCKKNNKMIKERCNENLKSNPKAVFRKLFLDYDKGITGVIGQDQVTYTNPIEYIKIVKQWWEHLFSKVTQKPKRQPE